MMCTLGFGFGSFWRYCAVFGGLLLMLAGCKEPAPDRGGILYRSAPFKVDATKIAGTYALRFPDASTEDDLSGVLTISNNSTRGFKFLITLETYACVGEVEGEAHFDSDSTAYYFERGKGGATLCELHFLFGPDRVSIDEINCLYYHGARCDFNGTYLRSEQGKGSMVR